MQLLDDVGQAKLLPKTLKDNDRTDSFGVVLDIDLAGKHQETVAEKLDATMT